MIPVRLILLGYLVTGKDTGNVIGEFEDLNKNQLAAFSEYARDQSEVLETLLWQG